VLAGSATYLAGLLIRTGFLPLSKLPGKITNEALCEKLVADAASSH
jgi:hypothetical protein